MRYGVRHHMAQLRALVICALAAATAWAAPAAGTETAWGARVETQIIQSELGQDDGDDIDSSGLGIRGDINFTLKPSKQTSIRADATARVFDYRDDDRATREIYGASLAISQKLSDQVELRLLARRLENVAVVESDSADQTSVEARLEWQQGNDRVRLAAEYRDRQYDVSGNPKGDGYRVAAQYNRRLGSYHWVRLDLRHENMNSTASPNRSFDRQIIQLSYSRPIAKQLRLIPSVEYRQWEFDNRTALGDPQGDPRRDSYVAPGARLAYGRETRGFYADLSAEFRLRQSNDIRYDKNGLRAGLKLGFRF